MAYHQKKHDTTYEGNLLAEKDTPPIETCNLDKKLNRRQRIFIWTAVNNPRLSLIESAAKAGYKDPRQAANKLMSNPLIRSEYNYLMNEVKKKYELNYDRAVQQFQPGGNTHYGKDEVIKFWKQLRNAFPNSLFSIDHIAFTEEINQPKKASVRWSLVGKHEGNGIFGKASNAKIYVMGINHVEFGPRGIKNEWVLYDETMIWKQILLKTG